jgi:anaerobic magnesium-protoporphyrin IX monomethyl ester cyclase
VTTASPQETKDLPPAAPRKPLVVFVRGPIVFADGSINNEATPCIAFAYLSAYLKRFGYPVAIVDSIGEGLNRVWPLEKYPGFSCHGLTFEETVARIPKEADVIAFSGMFSGEWPVIRDLITRVRGAFPKALLVAGGEHVTAMSEYSLRDCPALDVCVRGEGEHTFYELLEAYSEKKDFSMVEGISYLDAQGSYRENGGLPRIREPETIPWPNWPEGYLEKFWAEGKSLGVQTERDMPFMSSRGCPYRCTFCSSPQMWTTKYELRDTNDCIAEIKKYIAKYDVTSLQFYDLTAITKKSWIVEFCNKLLEHDIRLNWSLPSGTRSEVLDRETLSLIKRTGCHYLVYAPESGSPETLAKIQKQVKLDRMTESLKEAMRQGIVVRANLIIGFPSETRRNIYETLRFGLKLAVLGVDEVPIYLFSPYPGSQLFKELRAAGKLRVDDDYFFRLTSLNGKYLSAQSYNPRIGPLELGVYRTFFMVTNYVVGYLLYPKRIFRTIFNLSSTKATTVLEHRIKDALRRKSAAAQRK